MTTSVKGEDRLEEIAELVDPWPFQAWRKYVAEYVARGTDDATAHVAANARYGQLLDDARAKARQIAALPWGPAHLQLGQEVAVSPTYEYAADWTGQRMFIAGISVEPKSGGILYWTSDRWPPRDMGDIATDWRPEDLLPARAPSTKPDRESADEGAMPDAGVLYRLGTLKADLELAAKSTTREPFQISGMDAAANARDLGKAISALSKDTEASAGEQQ